MARNPFLDFLESHADADLAVLKELFRTLAKRTHPDLGAPDADDFVRLQEHYHEAIADLLDRSDRPSAAREATGRAGPDRPPREATLVELYRYKSHLPSLELDSRALPVTCLAAFRRARDAAGRYSQRAELALAAWDEQFHELRAQNARFPDVRMKYIPFVRGLSSFFDHQFMPNEFNLRVCRSYLAEIKPVTDVDPTASPLMRYNRSAAARSALYRMRIWLEAELDKPGVSSL